MKRFLCLFISFVLFAAMMSGCKSEQEIVHPAKFYYLSKSISYHKEDGMIVSEVHDINGIAEDLEKIADQYLLGPSDASHRSPFPQGTSVRKITHLNGILNIVLSSEFAELSGYELSLACACLTVTLQELADTQLVQISAENALLDGNEYITMSADSIVVYDEVKSTTDPE